MLMFFRPLIKLCMIILPFILIYPPVVPTYVYLFFLKKTGRYDGTSEGRLGKFLLNKAVIILTAIIFVVGLVFHVLFAFLANTTIGSFFEKENYNEEYYVYLQKENSQKEYKLRADIARCQLRMNVLECLIDKITDSHKRYVVEWVYWPNGGYIDFDAHEYSTVYPNKKMECLDDEFNVYYITLTNEKVND